RMRASRVEDDPVARDETLHVPEEDVRVLLRMGPVEEQESAREEERRDEDRGGPRPRPGRGSLQVARRHLAGHQKEPGRRSPRGSRRRRPPWPLGALPLGEALRTLSSGAAMGIFKAYDIRGKVPSELDPDLARK